MKAIRIKTTLLTITMMTLIIGIALFGIPLLDRDNAAEAITLYGVAQGKSEANFSHWAVGGVPSRGINRLKIQIGTVTMDSSYPTNGETLDLSGTFPNAVLFCVFATDSGYTFEYVHASGNAPATGLIKAYDGAGSEVTNGTDLGTYVVEYLAIGW